MGKADEISRRQLMVLTFVSLLSPLIRILPYSSVLFAGKAAWLCPIPAYILGLGLIRITRHLMGSANPGDGLADMVIKGLGGVFGRIFCILCALWLTFYAGFIVRSAAERLLSCVYPNGNTAILIIVSLIVSGITAYGNTRSLVRTAEVVFPVLIFVLIIAAVSAIPDVRIEYLTPVTYMDAGNVLLGAVPILNVISLNVYFLFLNGHVKESEGKKRREFPWLELLAIISAAVTLMTLGSVSDKLSLRLQNAFFVGLRNVRLFGTIERIEAVAVGIWIITDFAMVASLLMIVSQIWKRVLGTKKRALFVVPSGALAGVAAFIIASNAFSLLKWSELLVPAVNLVLSAVVIPILLVIGKIRKNSVSGLRKQE